MLLDAPAEPANAAAANSAVASRMRLPLIGFMPAR